MAQPVYSVSFARTPLTSTNTVYYTVPVGSVAVVRTMTFAWGTSAGQGGNASVLLIGTNSRVWTAVVPESQIGSALWDGRLVLPAGEQIRAAFTGTGTTYFTASGYLLSLP